MPATTAETRATAGCCSEGAAAAAQQHDQAWQSMNWRTVAQSAIFVPLFEGLKARNLPGSVWIFLSRAPNITPVSLGACLDQSGHPNKSKFLCPYLNSTMGTESTLLTLYLRPPLLFNAANDLVFVQAVKVGSELSSLYTFLSKIVDCLPKISYLS